MAAMKAIGQVFPEGRGATITWPITMLATPAAIAATS